MMLLVLLSFILGMARTYTITNQESAVSLNNEPVALYGRTSNGFGRFEEYAASLSGASIGLYQTTNYLSPFAQQVPAIYLQKLTEDVNPPQPTDSETDGNLETPLRESTAIRPRSASFSSASASADAAKQKTTADAVSAQGLPGGLAGLFGGLIGND